MIKRLFYLFMILAVAIACNNQQATTDEAAMTEEETAQVIAELTVANFSAEAANHVGQEIKITGTVNHTCKHGGQRMFIVEEGTEENVKIEAGENIDSFDAELEGSVVVVTGITKEMIVDETYLDEWEKEVMEGESEEMKIHDGEHGEHGESGEEGEGNEEGETEEDHHGTDLEKINNLRTMLDESEKDHLAFYSVECISYEIVPPPPPKED